MSDSFTAYMCKTTFGYDARADSDETPSKIYSSLKACQEGAPCTKQCGIVKVTVTLDEVVQSENY
jgi:hypothetical protein